MVSAEAVLEQVSSVLHRLSQTQFDTIRRVSEMLAGRIANGGVVHTFGTGHSRAFSMELSNRAGGLVPMHAMAIDDLLRSGRRTVNDINNPGLERDMEVARDLLDGYDIRDEDAAILVSNSGRNGSMVEMAIRLKGYGLPIVCVTSMEHTSQVTSRHPSGKRLFEVADYVIDNCGPYGDAVFEVPGVTAKVCALSSVTGAVIAQALTAEIVSCLVRRGVDVPVLMSANIDGSDAHNEALRARYAGRI